MGGTPLLFVQSFFLYDSLSQLFGSFALEQHPVLLSDLHAPNQLSSAVCNVQKKTKLQKKAITSSNCIELTKENIQPRLVAESRIDSANRALLLYTLQSHIVITSIK